MPALRKSTVLALLFAMVVAVFGAVQPALAAAQRVMTQDIPGPVTTGDGIVPVLHDNNPKCSDLGYGFGFKVNGAPAGTFPFDKSNGGELTGGALSDPNNSVTISNVVVDGSDKIYFDWSATLGIDAVIVKGGDNADAYVYVPEDKGDTGLHAPAKDNGELRNISHIEFCYDYELTVSKTANAKFTSTWTWDIEKTANETEVDATEITPDVFYTVKVSATSEDSDWAVDGEITIVNNTPLAATITGVSDNLAGFGAVDVSCPGGIPQVLAAGATLVCTYDTGPQASNDFGDLNEATVTTSGAVGGGTAEADVIFGDPTNEIDECIDVTDSLHGDLGAVCASQLVGGEYEFEAYYLDFTQIELACGQDNIVVNTASFAANDTEQSGEDSWTVTITLECPVVACTRTQGYWKTHSNHGPASYDETWALIGDDGEDSDFFFSDKSYYEVLWTSPAGNAYYILAHQYIAAELNLAKGTAMPLAVSTAFNAATALFGNPANTPAAIGALKGSNALRQQFIALAGILDAYNNGLTDGGPGHCAEVILGSVDAPLDHLLPVQVFIPFTAHP